MDGAIRPPIGARLSDLAETQQGYFTRSQAVREGVDDMALRRATKSGAIDRLDHGVYRITGAGQDAHERLRVAWLRLTPEMSPRQRTIHPHLWVAYRSAASLFGLGVIAADMPEFISDRRIQTRAEVRIRVRSEGLSRGEWMVHDGFAVTTPERTIADLAADRMDGGHLGRVVSDALATGHVTDDEVRAALAGRADLEAIVAQATGKAR
ncbi:MAG: type IV toxin-antitoxin system AbiEi family antitoxin domain-containing protein [Acidimicrobiia bacterium]